MASGIVEEVAAGRRTCGHCTNPIQKGERHIRFYSGGFGRNQSMANLCIRCMKDFVEENDK